MSLRESILVSVGRGLQNIPLSWARPFESLFVGKNSVDQDDNIIFLVGGPRSGSTLTYQCLIESIQPVYLSNIWNLVYDLPLVGGITSKVICSEYRSNFVSDEGFVSGLCGPAEGLRFWTYWGGYGLNEDMLVSEEVARKRTSYLRRVVDAITSPSRPMVSGYAGHVLWFERLRRNFPSAVFIGLRRDPLSNAVSLLATRRKRNGEWFSLFPHECNQALGGGLYQEIASQVYWLNRRLSELEKDDRTFFLNYEQLCDDPNSGLRFVIESCNTLGMKVAMKRTLPEAFEYRVASTEDDADTALLAQELDRLEAENGPIR